MGSIGDAYGNAMCENSCAMLECALFDRRKFRTKLRHAWSSSGSSKAGTIEVADTRLGDISRPSMTNDAPSMGKDLLVRNRP